MDWANHEFVRPQIARAQAWLLVTLQDLRFDHVLSQKIESPLEAAFLVWWQVQSYNFSGFPELSVDVVTQMPVDIRGERFRLDAAFVPMEPILRSASDKLHAPLKVAIEFDGHEFHERTKEQVALRNHRDRLLQSDGWSVLHFSGSELFREPTVWVEPFIRAIAPQMKSLRERVSQILELT